MPRSPDLYLDDIVDAIGKIERYARRSAFFLFIEETMRRDAIIRNLEIIGEAVKHLPLDLKQKYPLEWNKIAGMRDILSHAYFGIDDKILDDVIKNKIPELKKVIISMREGNN